MQLLRRMAVGIALAFLSACTTTTVTPIGEQKAPHTFSAVTLGEIVPADKLWAGAAERFRRGFIARLQETKALEVAQSATAGTLRVSGQITQIDKGDRALRFLIGFGAGSAHVEGRFQITDAAGTVLSQFTTGKTYAGGMGIGGAADFLDMDDLVEKLGAATADAVVSWAKGGGLSAIKSSDPST